MKRPILRSIALGLLLVALGALVLWLWYWTPGGGREERIERAIAGGKMGGPGGGPDEPPPGVSLRGPLPNMPMTGAGN